tara:strand:+ start:60321 stop:62123 length:1803 start_codon:yes stop_codon:yes gene_type:complete
MANDQNQKKLVPINYTSREFESIREDLIDLAERFYPDTFQDFSEGSFGAMMIDSVAYVGDQLSLYLDYNVNESFLDTAYQYSNILRHGRVLGYKDLGRPSTFGTVALYIMIPAYSVAMGPDSKYLPILKRGAQFVSQAGLNFILTENVDFSNPKNSVVVARVDESTGAPTHYAIKAYGNVVSGQMGSEKRNIGSFERFLKVTLTDPNISEIISVFDSEGNEYYEVDYLSQDMIFKEVTNNNFKQDNVPSILKPMLVSRKFVVEREGGSVSLQFGSGELGATNVVAIPQAVALSTFGKRYVTSTAFDPTRLSQEKSMGICPANTTLYISYRSISPTNSNSAVGSVNQTKTFELEYSDRESLAEASLRQIAASLEVSNETPIVGDVSNPGSSELKRRIYDTFPTQNRAVTQADYENVAYRMPSKFGSIKRVSTQKDQDSLKRNLNMYVISEDEQGHLVNSNQTIKNNLKTWLNNYRMINDTIDLLDPYIINVGLEFVIRASVGENKTSLLGKCVSVLGDKFSEKFFIGEPIFVSDIYSELKNITGVLDVVKVKIINKTGSTYSGIIFDINRNMSPDGTYVVAPANAIFELKYPAVDIKGKIR